MQRVSHELAEHTGKCGGLYKIIWVLIRLGGPTNNLNPLQHIIPADLLRIK